MNIFSKISSWFYKRKEVGNYIYIRILFFKFRFFNCQKLEEIKRIWPYLEVIKDRLERQANLVAPCLKAHARVFPKYKGIYRNKDIVIVASGPSLNKYKPIECAIHIGVNNVYKNKKINLDYLFIQDSSTIYEPAADTICAYRRDSCKKFFGRHYMFLEKVENSMFSEIAYEKANAEEYYFISRDMTEKYILCSPDITSRPLNTWGSVTFSALEFALWTHPRRIFLVGVDCSLNGYFIEQNSLVNTTKEGYDYMYLGWLEMKKFIRGHYPDIEIISVNPVGLKGLFEDIYTD